MKFTLGPYHLLMFIWCHIAWRAKTNMQSSLRCNQLMLYTTYNTDLRGTSWLSTVVSYLKAYPYLYGAKCSFHLTRSTGSIHISVSISLSPGIQNAVSSLTLLLVMQDSRWWYTLEFEVGSFSVYDSDSLVTLWLACFVLGNSVTA